MGTEIDESYIMMHIMNSKLSAYDNLINMLEDKLRATGDPRTLKTLREKLSEKYEKNKSRKKFMKDNEDSDEESKPH